jgi:hypothetical protein
MLTSPMAGTNGRESTRIARSAGIDGRLEATGLLLQMRAGHSEGYYNHLDDAAAPSPAAAASLPNRASAVRSAVDDVAGEGTATDGGGGGGDGDEPEEWERHHHLPHCRGGAGLSGMDGRHEAEITAESMDAILAAADALIAASDTPPPSPSHASVAAPPGGTLASTGGETLVPSLLQVRPDRGGGSGGSNRADEADEEEEELLAEARELAAELSGLPELPELAAVVGEEAGASTEAGADSLQPT